MPSTLLRPGLRHHLAVLQQRDACVGRYGMICQLYSAPHSHRCHSSHYTDCHRHSGCTCGKKDDGKADNADAPADSLALLTKVWDSYTDDEKFPAAGGDYETSVDDAPGAFDPSNADNLNFLLTVPTEDASLIDDAASLMHMMNANTFTCGALRVKNGDDAAKLAEDLRDAIQNKQWMCGFPDKLVIATLGNYVVSVYGDEELVNTFRDKLQAAYSDAAIAYDEMIGEGEFSDGEDTALEAPVA